jgi:hypothetical protein
MTDWRDIPLCDIDWRRVIRRGHVAGKLTWLCYEPRTAHPVANRGEWAKMTLGELANMGERWWQRYPGIGAVATEAIKDVIDRAATGENVRRPSPDTPAPDAYVPRCERKGGAK